MIEKKEQGDLNSQMVTDAMVIIKSVGFLESQIDWNLSLMEEAMNNKFFDDVPIIEDRIRALLDKVANENVRMDEFMKKYSSKIENEKKTILSGVK